MRIVISGAGGQLGQELQRAVCEQFGEAAQITALDRAALDICDAASVYRVLGEAQPDVVIQAGALTDTGRCEREPELAYRVNALGPRTVASACHALGATLVHVSTNEVFDGAKRDPYPEYDPANPLNSYARSKRAGEEAVMSVLPRHYIVRTAWLYGANERMFPAKMIAAADKNGRLSVVDDEIATPTYVTDLADAIAKLISIPHPSYGIYHFTNSGMASRYEWAKLIMDLSGRSHIPVEPISTAEFRNRFGVGAGPLKAPYSVLANLAGASAGITLRPWEDALRACFEVAKEHGVRALMPPQVGV